MRLSLLLLMTLFCALGVQAHPDEAHSDEAQKTGDAATVSDAPSDDAELEGEYEEIEEDVESDETDGDEVELEGEYEDVDEEDGDSNADEVELTDPTEQPPELPSAPTKSDTTPSTANAQEQAVAPAQASDADVSQEAPARGWRIRVGDATPLTQREPLLKQFTIEADLRYGLVGTGPTRFVNDLRFGIFDWWELRTTFAPYPAALMSRFKIGKQQGPFGALLIDGGLANFDAGIRILPDNGNTELGVRFHVEGGVAYIKSFADRFAIYTSARTRYRYSMLSNDNQLAVALDANMTYDLLQNLALTGGVGYAEVIGTPVRELAVPFVETDRPGMSHFLLRNDGWARSITLPLALTYGRVDSFDVDLFVTPRIWPEFDILFGAGLRVRVNVFGG